eukprot:11308963-Prorocentrum_lima.AAC.1
MKYDFDLPPAYLATVAPRIANRCLDALSRYTFTPLAPSTVSYYTFRFAAQCPDHITHSLLPPGLSRP